MATSTPSLADDVFDQMTTDPRWLGFGYLGGRCNALSTTDPESPAQPERVAATDRLILDRVRQHGWGYDRLFTWANSKDGRLLAEAMFGSDETAEAAWHRATSQWRLLPVARAAR